MIRQNATKADIEFLSQYGLKESELKNAMRYHFEQKEYVSQEGEPIHTLFFVLCGKAKVCINVSDGNQLLLCYFQSKGIVGDIELMAGRSDAVATMQAISEFECVGLPISDCEVFLKNNVIFANQIGKELAEKLLSNINNRAITSLQPLEARLCAYIAQTSTHGVFRENHTEVAEMLATSYRHLLRCLNLLCINKILTKEAYGYKIIDYKSLSEKAGDLYTMEDR